MRSDDSPMLLMIFIRIPSFYENQGPGGETHAEIFPAHYGSEQPDVPASNDSLFQELGSE